MEGNEKEMAQRRPKKTSDVLSRRDLEIECKGFKSSLNGALVTELYLGCVFGFGWSGGGRGSWSCGFDSLQTTQRLLNMLTQQRTYVKYLSKHYGMYSKRLLRKGDSEAA